MSVRGAVVENQREDLLRRVRIYINEDHFRQSNNNVQAHAPAARPWRGCDLKANGGPYVKVDTCCVQELR